MLNSNWILLTDPRCGGTVLRETLNQHSQLVCPGELMETYKDGYVAPASDQEWIDYINRAFVNAPGWHVQRYSIPARCAGWARLSSIPSLKVISLIRVDLTAHYMSWKFAQTTNHWHSRPEELPTIPWDEKEYVRWTTNTIQRRKQTDWVFRNNSVLSLTHEDIVADFTSVLKRVQSFLEISEEELTPIQDRLPEVNYRDVFTDYPDFV